MTIKTQRKVYDVNFMKSNTFLVQNLVYVLLIMKIHNRELLNYRRLNNFLYFTQCRIKYYTILNTDMSCSMCTIMHV